MKASTRVRVLRETPGKSLWLLHDVLLKQVLLLEVILPPGALKLLRFLGFRIRKGVQDYLHQGV